MRSARAWSRAVSSALSRLGRLPSDAFAELLALPAALDAPTGVDGARRALSVDGQVEVVLTDPHDGQSATIPTGDGVLRGPDLLVSIPPVRDVGRDLREAVSG